MSSTTTTPQFTSLRQKIAFETAARKARYAKFTSDFDMAMAAGAKAAREIVPEAMHISGADADGVRRCWAVPEGVCGYAYITVRPANSSFGRWLVKEGHARKAYGGGLTISISDYNQSMARKAAHAKAAAEFLTAQGYTGVDWFERID